MIKARLASVPEYWSRAFDNKKSMQKESLFVFAPESIYHWAQTPNSTEQDEFNKLKHEIQAWAEGKDVKMQVSGWTGWLATNDHQCAIEFKLIFC